MNKLLPLAVLASAAVVGRQSMGRRAKGGYTRADIRKLGYSDTAINRALAALERTPSGRDAGPKGALIAKPPKAVRDAAFKGLKIRARMPPSRRGGTDIGVGRAIQLALGTPLPERSIKRMRAYFSRHARDFRPGWDAPGDESKGYIAWLLWGGNPGRTWAEKQYKTLGRRATDPLNAFMEDYRKVTSVNPMWSDTRIWQGKNLPIIITEIRPYRPDNVIVLHNILSPEARGKGGGNAVLAYLTSLADKHGVTVVLAAVPVKAGGTGRKPLTKKRLIQWYKSHGFEERYPGARGKTDELIRRPRTRG